MVSSRVPAVSAGKPAGAVQSIYDKYNFDGITVWMNREITPDSRNEITIGYSKFLFFGELTVKGIDLRLCVD